MRVDTLIIQEELECSQGCGGCYLLAAGHPRERADIKLSYSVLASLLLNKQIVARTIHFSVNEKEESDTFFGDDDDTVTEAREEFLEHIKHLPIGFGVTAFSTGRLGEVAEQIASTASVDRVASLQLSNLPKDEGVLSRLERMASQYNSADCILLVRGSWRGLKRLSDRVLPQGWKVHITGDQIPAMPSFNRSRAELDAAMNMFPLTKKVLINDRCITTASNEYCQLNMWDLTLTNCPYMMRVTARDPEDFSYCKGRYCRDRV